MEKRTPFLLAVGAFRLKFYGNGVIPCQNVWYRSIGSWLRYNFAAGRFWTMKLCSRHLMVFGRNFCEKTTKLGIWTPFWERQGWRMTLVDGSLKVSGWLSIRVNCTFVLSIMIPSYEAKCVQLGCFHRDRPLCTETLHILREQGRPHEPFLAPEN